MDDDVFLARLQDKLERITNRDVELRVVDDDPTYLEVDLEGATPRVVLGRNVYDYPGFAQMCLESTKAGTSGSWSFTCCWLATNVLATSPTP